MPLSLDCEVLPAYMSPRPSFPCKLPLISKHPNSRSQQSCADNRKHLLHAKHLELRPWHKRRLKAAVQVTEARLSRVPIPKHEELPVLSHCICMTPQNLPPAKCARQLPLRTSLPWFAQPPDHQCENKGARTSWALVGASQTGTCHSGGYLRCWRASARCAESPHAAPCRGDKLSSCSTTQSPPLISPASLLTMASSARAVWSVAPGGGSGGDDDAGKVQIVGRTLKSCNFVHTFYCLILCKLWFLLKQSQGALESFLHLLLRHRDTSRCSAGRRLGPGGRARRCVVQGGGASPFRGLC